MTSTHAKYYTAIEWIFFIGLCGLALYFTEEVFLKFLEGKSSFSQSEESIKDLPSFTICFKKQNFSITNYEYGTDFAITYFMLFRDKSDYVVLEEGKKLNLSIYGVKEVVHIDMVMTHDYGKCYRITAISESKHWNLWRMIQFDFFNEMNPQYVDQPKILLFITSDKNSYGAVRNIWKNGKEMKMEIEKGFYKSLYLKAEQYNYLTDSYHSKCNYESFYECWSRQLSKALEGENIKCSPFSLPNLPICKTNETQSMLSQKILNNILENDTCPKLCTMLEYSGSEYEYESEHGISVLFYLISNKATIYDEYLIYDVINAIGAIGGTLGMCIGFSFSGVISFVIGILQEGIGKFRSLSKNQNVSQVSLPRRKRKVGRKE